MPKRSGGHGNDRRDIAGFDVVAPFAVALAATMVLLWVTASNTALGQARHVDACPPWGCWIVSADARVVSSPKFLGDLFGHRDRARPWYDRREDLRP